MKSKQLRANLTFCIIFTSSHKKCMRCKPDLICTANALNVSTLSFETNTANLGCCDANYSIWTWGLRARTNRLRATLNFLFDKVVGDFDYNEIILHRTHAMSCHPRLSLIKRVTQSIKSIIETAAAAFIARTSPENTTFLLFVSLAPTN